MGVAVVRMEVRAEVVELVVVAAVQTPAPAPKALAVLVGGAAVAIMAAAAVVVGAAVAVAASADVVMEAARGVRVAGASGTRTSPRSQLASFTTRRRPLST